jgi:ABC-2 type transport system ATP-binding protein
MWTNMNAVEFREVRKVYRSGKETRVALDGLTLDIPEGQIYGFAGPNGAGKSTSIKILIGLVRPTSGSVSIFGHPAGSREARELLGFLPEVTLYHEFMGAEELLTIHAGLLGLSSSDRKPRIKEVMEAVGLWERRGSRIKDFSKGMKQRFGIALAILGRPRLLVLDELTSGLDPQAQANLLNLICELKKQGMTIFFSSHHLVEIEKVCDSVAILHRGTLRGHGTLHEMLGDGQRCTVIVKPADGVTIDSALWSARGDGTFQRSIAREESGAELDTLRAQGVEIVELRSERQSLESVFHRLTPELERTAS